MENRSKADSMIQAMLGQHCIDVNSLAQLGEFLPDAAMAILREGNEAFNEGQESWDRWYQTRFKPHFKAALLSE
jgi:hypothetical protein